MTPTTHAHEGELVVFNIGMTVRRWWRPDLWLPAFFAMPRMIAELSRNKAAAERGEEEHLGFLGADTLFGAKGPWVVQSGAASTTSTRTRAAGTRSTCLRGGASTPWRASTPAPSGSGTRPSPCRPGGSRRSTAQAHRSGWPPRPGRSPRSGVAARPASDWPPPAASLSSRCARRSRRGACPCDRGAGHTPRAGE